MFWGPKTFLGWGYLFFAVEKSVVGDLRLHPSSGYFFTNSALWARLVIELPFPFVCVYICHKSCNC